MDDERLRRTFGVAADEIDAGDATTALAAVRATMRGRRRRRRTLAAVGVTAVLTGGAATVLSVRGTDGGDVLRSAPGSTAVEATVTTVDGMSDVPTTVGTERASGVPVQVVDVRPSTVPTPGADDGNSYVSWLVPWADGFLSLSNVTTPQPLPAEIPAEFTALFSAEVQELFADGLPATIDEATAMLSEAGLLDEVTAVVADNPEVSNLIYSVPTATPEAAVWFSPDGDEWNPVDVTLPDGMSSLQEVVVAGDRLVAVDTRQDRDAITLTVASTTDLTTWETQTIEIPRPADLPAVVNFSAWPATIAANESGWVLEVHRFTDVPVETFLPTDVRESIDHSVYGGGFSTDENGLEVQIGTSAEGDQQTYSYTWEELDIDPAVIPYLDDPSETQLWTAAFGGDPTMASDVPPQSGIVALPDRFVRTQPSLETSTDGVVWTTVDVPWQREVVNSVIAVDGGVVVFTQDDSGTSHAYRADPSFHDWTPIDIPGAPEWWSPVFGLRSSSPAVIVDTFRPEMPSQEIVVEYDGFVVTTGSGVASLWYDVVERATGDVVASESIDLATLSDGGGEDGPFEHLRYHSDGSGLTVDDPESGAVIVSIPQDVLDRAAEEAYGGDVAEEYRPDLWLIATIDGDRWLVDNLDDDVEALGPSLAAVNGDIVLVAVQDGWLRYDIGS